MNPGSSGKLVSIDDFLKLDIRVGIVLEALPFADGKHSTHILKVDFGTDLGIKKTLARLAPNYHFEDLVGNFVTCVVNFPARQIGNHQSEVLILGVPDEQGHTVLIRPHCDVPIGGRVH